MVGRSLLGSCQTISWGVAVVVLTKNGRAPLVRTPIASTFEVGGIVFEEFPSTGYAARTRENAKADVTIAIARDATTAGERLTAKTVAEQGRVFVPVDYWQACCMEPEAVLDAVERLNQASDAVEGGEISLNVAGNGLYTLKEANQQIVDERVYAFLAAVLGHPDFRGHVKLVRSGGQTGVDEAGVKAAVRLGLPALVTAPKGWVFRGRDGKDVADQEAFVARFRGEGDLPLGSGEGAGLAPGVDSGKLRESVRREREEGPLLDAEWAKARTEGVIPTCQCEAMDAVLSGNTYPIRSEISRFGGTWNGAAKTWTIPAFGAEFADRRNVRLVEARQAFLDGLAAKGVSVTYRRMG